MIETGRLRVRAETTRPPPPPYTARTAVAREAIPLESYRIVNFAFQLGYLLAHAAFTGKILRIRRATPVWTWFFLFSVSMWLWVSGRFAESVVYLFFPDNNPAYVFAANYQYIGITMAASTYFIWSLYLAGKDRTAQNPAVVSALILYPLAVCGAVFTNGRHHLFYTALEMGRRVAHGPLFLPAVLTGYLLMLAGYLLSAADIVRRREQVARKLLLFSAFPFLPAAAIAVRTISGVDRFDYTPVVMGAAYFCLYLVVFRYNDAGIIPASMREVVEQAPHPVWICDPAGKNCSYRNRSARERYADALAGLLPALPQAGDFEQGDLHVTVTPLPESGEVLITAADLSGLSRQIAELEETIAGLKAAGLALEEEYRNIDAYPDAARNADRAESRQALIDRVRGQTAAAFAKLKANLEAAAADPGSCEGPLRENLAAAEACMAQIRAAVAQLAEE